MSETRNYALDDDGVGMTVPAPELNYRPRLPEIYRPKIGLIGCGGITATHLKVYRSAGLEVVAFCDLERERAEARREEYYPSAIVCGDAEELLSHDEIDVVDIPLHPEARAPIIEQALLAGKHVLSQKPFAMDLDVATQLADLADEKKLLLAVNQNGRWAPYARYMQLAIEAGHIGRPHTVNVHIAWDHTWIKGTAFEKIHHIILYDFGVHWVDMVCNIFGESATAANAFVRSSLKQTLQSPLMVSCQLAFPSGVANLIFDATQKHNARESIIITGESGKLTATGEVLKVKDVTLFNDAGVAKPVLEGSWIPDGFCGTMGELLCAIEEKRQPSNSARNNLRTLEALFALVQSADAGAQVKIGESRALGDSCRIL